MKTTWKRKRIRNSGLRDRWSVLLAEDNDDHAMLTQMALERASRVPVEVHRARDGDEALIALETIVPDLVLLDLKMPVRNGLEVLAAIKGNEDLRRIPVAVLTSSDRADDAAQTFGLGGNHFITKPGNPEELERRLGSLLRNLGELSRIRRAPGRIAEAAAAGRNGPPAGQFIAQVTLVIVMALLIAFAIGMV